MIKEANRLVTRYTARGLPYPYLESAMPRIEDSYLDSVVYLYPSKHEAMEGFDIGGSGFLLSVPCKTVPGQFIYAVTNRHVIEGGSLTVRLNTADGDIDAFEFKKTDWICSETDDLAICVLPRLVQKFAVRSLRSDWLLTEKDAKIYDIGIGDEIILLGRFINREGIQQNAPTARFGFIANMMKDPVEYKIGSKEHKQESVLCEVKSIGGYSGSAVFLTPDPTVGRHGKPVPDVMTWVLGVDCCHIQSWESAYDDKGHELKHVRIAANTGMMAVVPAWKLIDLLGSEKAVRQRDKDEEKRRAVRNLPTAAPDASHSPSTDENPNHLKDFTRLVAVAARKRPRGDQT
jgi:hypothetical protein